MVFAADGGEGTRTLVDPDGHRLVLT